MRNNNSSLDFFDIAILGVPKAGTSSVFSALADHPSVIGSIPKETFFFLDNSHPLCGNSGYSLLRDGEEKFQNYNLNVYPRGINYCKSYNYKSLKVRLSL